MPRQAIHIRRALTRLRHALKKRRREERISSLQIEALEQRSLLALTPIAFAVETGVVEVIGTAEADSVTVESLSATEIQVTLKAPRESISQVFNTASVSSIVFAGLDGDDAFLNWTKVPSLVDGGAGNDKLQGGNGGDMLFGGIGNDHLLGGGGNDLLFGGAGKDRLEGELGADELHGEESGDLLYGGEGDDTLHGGDGDDYLYGEAGNDTIHGDLGNDGIWGHEGNDLVYGDEGDDRIEGGDGDDQLLGGAGNDIIKGELGADVIVGGDDTDSLFGGDGNDSVEGGAGNDNIYGEAGNDYIHGDAGDDLIFGQDGNDLIYGDEGDDRIEGGNDGDRIFGGAGQDIIKGGQGPDALLGGADADSLFGGEGPDSLFGGSGNDKIYGETGNDFIHGDSGDDSLFGQEGNDLIYGDEGNDLIEGHSGDDRLLGGDGNDYIVGGLGADTLLGEGDADSLFGGDDNDSLFGGSGNDNIYGQAGNDFIHGDDGDDGLYGQDGNDLIYGDEGNDRIEGNSGDDRLLGGAGNDYIKGDLGADTLLGEGDADTLFGGDDNDTLDGGDGDDNIYGEAGNDFIRGRQGNDGLYGQDGDDLIYGDEGDDRIEGSSGNDRLIGGAGSDYIKGDVGADTLLGENGADSLFGGDGNDFLDGGDGDDNIYGEAGNDLIRGRQGNDGLYGQDGDDQIHGDRGDDLIVGGADDDRLIGGSGKDYIEGGLGADTLLGDGDADMLFGGEGNDTLEGAAGNDKIYGEAGNDYIRGHLGNDELYGQDGDDLIYGDNGDDLIQGGAGNDLLFGGNGNDTLAGGFGNDNIYGGADNDFIRGDQGDDWLYGHDGGDVIYGDEGNDRLFGGSQDDQLFGGTDNDILFGNSGNDRLWGQSGNDALSGNDGEDRLEGSTGDDVLIGGADVDALFGTDGEDIVISAQTAFDDSATDLQSILDRWSGEASYAQRVAALSVVDRDGIGFEILATVFDDGVSNQVWGGGGLDWTIMATANPTYNPTGSHHADGEMVHHATGVVYELPIVEGFDLIDSFDVMSALEEGEVLTHQLPHSSSLVKSGEHLRLFQLIRYADVTHIAMNSGSWSDPATWMNGQLPDADARVLIPIGVEVTVDSKVAAEVFTVRIDGTLKFATDVDSELRADTVVVTHSGHFEMGSSTAPMEGDATARLVFTDNGAIDRSWDPYGISRGLIAHGTVDIYGEEKTSFVEAAGTLPAGASLISLASVPENWRVGDKIVIAGSSSVTNQDEERTILAIDGSIVRVAPLSYTHTSPNTNMRVHVANLSRNAVLESEGDAAARRGHVMFMHNRDVEVAYAGFYELGRTDKSVDLNDSIVNEDWQLELGTGTNDRARYAVHFHRNGTLETGTPATVIGSVVAGSPGWGFVNHSSYVNFTDNVAYDVLGAAFVSEAGNEVGIFDNNFAVHMEGAGTGRDVNSRELIQDLGHGGDGFWIQSPGITVVNNVVSGAAGIGYAYYFRGLREFGYETQFDTANLDDPSIANGAETISVRDVAPALFENNVAYASLVGLHTRYVNFQSTTDQEAIFKDALLWNTRFGLDISYTQNTTFQDITVIHDASAKWEYGMQRNLVTRDIRLLNVSVIGYQNALMVPVQGTTFIQGGVYANGRNFVLGTTAFTDRVFIVSPDVTELGYPW